MAYKLSVFPFTRLTNHTVSTIVMLGSFKKTIETIKRLLKRLLRQLELWLDFPGMEVFN